MSSGSLERKRADLLEIELNLNSSGIALDSADDRNGSLPRCDVALVCASCSSAAP